MAPARLSRHSVPALILAAAVAALAGCGGEPAPRHPLRIGVYADPLDLDPHLHNEFLTLSILSNVYEGLTAFDHLNRVQPGLAASWENPNDVTWLFRLRRDARFHDGRPVRAADVVFSLERARRHPRSGLANYLVAVRELRAVDERTIELVTERPYAILLNKLASVFVVPADSPERITRPVGSGPYEFVRRLPGGGLELRAFAEHWDGPAGEPRAEIVAVADAAARVEALVAGDLDVVLDLPAELAGRVAASDCCRVVSREGLVVDYLQMRVDRPPFSDRRLRQAIDLAVDRRALVERVLYGHGRPIGQLAGRDVFGYVPELEPSARDLGRARELLAAAGHPGGLELALEYRAGREVEELRRQLAEAGIRLRLVPRPWGEMYPRLQSGEVEFYFGGVLARSADASDIFDSKIHTRDPRRGYGDTNSNAYSNPELDRLIELSGLTLDMLERREILQRSMRVLMADLAHVPLYVADDLYAVRAGVRWQPRLDGRVLAREIARGEAGE